MFVVEVVALLTTFLFLRDLAGGADHLGFSFQIILWLWFTLFFANFAEAMAEGRGKAQADALRATRTTTPAKRLLSPDDRELYEGAAASPANDEPCISASDSINRGELLALTRRSSPKPTGRSGGSSPTTRWWRRTTRRSARHSRSSSAWAANRPHHHRHRSRRAPGRRICLNNSPKACRTVAPDEHPFPPPLGPAISRATTPRLCGAPSMKSPVPSPTPRHRDPEGRW